MSGEKRSTTVERAWRSVMAAFGRVRPFPYVAQINQAECGLACLAMVLTYFGKQVRLETIREALEFNRDGVSALSLLDAGRRFGLRGRGVRFELDGLSQLPRGTILHWGFNHFVVFDRFDGKTLYINDPGTAPRLVSRDVAAQKLTGIAIVFEPGTSFERERLPNATLALLKRVLADDSSVLRLLAITLVAQIVSLTLPLLTGVVVDRVIPRHDESLWRTLTVGVVFVAVYYAALLYVREQLIVVLRVKLDTSLVIGMLEHMLALPFSYFQARIAGHLVYRFSSADHLRDTLGGGVPAAVVDAGFAFIALAILCVASPGFAALALLVAIVQVGATIFVERRLVRLWERDLEILTETNGILMEVLNGIETLKAAGAEGRVLSDWSNRYIKAAHNLVRRGSFEGFLVAMRQVLAFVGPITLLLFGASEVLDGTLPLGQMLALYALGVAFLMPLGQATSMVVTLGSLRVHAARIDEVFAQSTEAERHPGTRALRISGHVSVKDVAFRYGSRGRDVLSDVSLEVPAGAFVAIVGASGSGKTSLGRVLLGLLKPSAGEVFFDGIPLSELDLVSLRQQVGVVSQHTSLLARSVRDNVTLLDNSVPIEDIEHALQLACVFDDVQRLPVGIHSEISEDGRSLSGGQRQRIALARALVRKPVILLLDEATSALDAATEQQVQQNLESLSATRIVIAHRLSTVQNADLIVVMDDGHIVEKGTHQELLTQNGAYARLVAKQLASDDT